ncbi:hypothetical protein MSAN_01226100 [Mycena sanguinolenta]|uniref:BTB domain-containing protein n=1 Tax=Mycena sanguinolenta TaxID=230812 RepID=A0A8H6YD39_9AGAR|nr:hypothetical protein MSAN_01226100 [Mycena sanguinolenta]
MATSTTLQTSISERFDSSDADVTVRSSDGVLFKLHRMNLKLHSDIFANADNTTRPENGDEVVYLDEASDVLDLLFQFMYRQPQPNLQVVEASLFFRLAEAAEKYLVYSAMPVVMMQAKEHIPQHPLQVLNFAALHGYVEVANKAARASVGRPMADAVKFLAPAPLAKWVRSAIYLPFFSDEDLQAVFYDKFHTGARSAVARIAGENKLHRDMDFDKCIRDPASWYELHGKFRSITLDFSFLEVDFIELELCLETGVNVYLHDILELELL